MHKAITRLGLRGAFLGAAVLAALPAHPDRASESSACRQVKAQIRRVESQMRAGYTARQGARLEARLRKLRKKRYRVCR